MRGIRMMGVVLATGAILVSSTLPASAHLSAYTGPVPPAYPAPPANSATGAALAKAAISPDLPVFPCGVAGPALDAILLAASTEPNKNWDNDRYAPCYGDLYAAPAAVNTGLTGGAGIDHKADGISANDELYAFQTLPGSVTANYTYSEPCQDLNGGDPPPPEAITGEAIGWIQIDADAVGVHGTDLVTHANVISQFWWSRVGLTAIVWLSRTITDLTAAPVDAAPFKITTGGAIASAVFIPTVLPNCAAPTHTHPNDILIAAQAEGAGTGLI